MKFICPFCNLRCKSTSGLIRHTRQKHNFRTRHQSFNNQETELSNPIAAPIFPVHQDFTKFHDQDRDEDLDQEEDLDQDEGLHQDKGSHQDTHFIDEDPDDLTDRIGDSSDSELCESDEPDRELDGVSLDSSHYDTINRAPEIDNIVYDLTGGQVIDDEEARKRHDEFIDRLGWVPESDMNNPLHPWRHEGEVWLTNLLFRNGNMSRATADEFLRAFANGKIAMVDGPIQFANSREMIQLLDVAARKGVVGFFMLFMYIYRTTLERRYSHLAYRISF
jgi:hypothetical protein